MKNKRNKTPSILKKFETILDTNDFTQLAPFIEPTAWDEMTKDERELLGLLFMKQGQQQLQNGDNRVLESFDRASKLLPNNPSIYFHQAIAFISHEGNINCYTAASKALEKTIELDPNHIQAWFGWGDVLVKIGTFYEDSSYFYQASDKFSEVQRLSQSLNLPLPDRFYWTWGLCWYKVGKYSGEAVDFIAALEKLRLAVPSEQSNGQFCNDFGNVLIEIAFLFDRNELFFEAVDFYKIGVSQFPEQYEAWLNLACTYQRLHNIHKTENYFQEADSCFEKAASINSDDSSLWLRWGELFANAGKFDKDMERIFSSFNKFEQANLRDPNNPHVLAQWGEAQMLAASYSENFDLFREAEIKIAKAIEINPNVHAIWHLYGTCLYELGRYFNDIEYFHQAVEKFSHGITLSDDPSLHHHGLVLTYTAIGELTANAAMYENAIRHLNIIADLNQKFHNSIWNDWGVALMKLGELTNDKRHIEAAAEKFERAINIKSNQTFADDIEIEWLYNYGCAMDFLGDFHEDSSYYERSVQVLSQVLQIDPDYTHARYNLALSLSHLGELTSDLDCFHKAIDLFEELLRQDNEDEVAWNDWGVTLLNLAFLTSDASDAEASQKIFEDAESKLLHSVALGNVHAYYNLACQYALTKNLSAAMHYLEKAEHSNALPPVDNIIHDEWLDNLRHLQPFRLFLSGLLNKHEKDK